MTIVYTGPELENLTHGGEYEVFSSCVVAGSCLGFLVVAEDSSFVFVSFSQAICV